MRQPSTDRISAMLADRVPVTLAWLGTFGAALAVAGVHYPGRTLFTLLFLMITPVVCVAQLLPGLDPAARAMVSIAGGIALISTVAEVMLAAKWWTPRGGLITVGVLCAVLLAIAFLRRPRSRASTAPAGPHPQAEQAEQAEQAVPSAAASPRQRGPAPPDDDAWIYEE